MATNIMVPTLGESVTEATVSKWLKKVGDPVARDEPLVELETDKVTLEVPSPAAGTLGEILVPDGRTVGVGAALGIVSDGPGAAKASAKAAAAPAPAATATSAAAASASTSAGGRTTAAVTPAAAPPLPQPNRAQPTAAAPATAAAGEVLAPAVRKLVEEQQLDPGKIPATGKDGRLTKGDVLAYLETRQKAAAPSSAPLAAPTAPATPSPSASPASTASSAPPQAQASAPSAARDGEAPLEERVRMSRLRRTIAARLKEAQNNAAMLTTFNEVDMGEVMRLREHYRESFEKKHGVRLGFMSFFVKACVVGLKEIPSVNAQIDGDDLVYKNHYDFGVAIGGGQGLVVPVIRDVDRMGFADIEKAIADLGRRARDGKLKLEELTGGTFSITNGGIYGSLMSTPILNPPQSAILGMHKIEERPVAVAGKVEIRPMMYLALSYDHRVIDGREAVTFLVRVKACIEDPERILLDM